MIINGKNSKNVGLEYTYERICSNCDDTQYIFIPKNVKVVDFLAKGVKCLNCGCNL